MKNALNTNGTNTNTEKVKTTQTIGANTQKELNENIRTSLFIGNTDDVAQELTYQDKNKTNGVYVDYLVENFFIS